MIDYILIALLLMCGLPLIVFAFALLLMCGLPLIVFAFVEYVLFEPKCKHKKFSTRDSYHKKVCVDCGFEVSTDGVKK